MSDEIYEDVPRTSSSRDEVKKRSMAKRNRLISLRSRKNQNLTKDADFIEVLDSLKVERHESSAKSDQEDNTVSSHIRSVDLTSNLEILDENRPMTSRESESTAADSLSNSKLQLNHNNNNTSVKNLKSHKRKIEQDDDFYQPKRSQGDSQSESQHSDENLGFNKPAKGEEKTEKRRNYRNLNSTETNRDEEDS